MNINFFKFYGLIIAYILKLVLLTLKIKVIKKSELNTNDSYIYGCWHNKMAITIFVLTTMSKKNVALVSPSNDGELISVPLQKLKCEVVRGSSGSDSVKSVLKLIKLIKNGYNAGTPLDGPKGPVYKVKPGMLFLSQKSGKPLILAGVATDRKWIFKKTWDKIELPKFFSKSVCVLSEPIIIPKEANLDEYLEIVERKLNEINKEAEFILKNNYEKY